LIAEKYFKKALYNDKNELYQLENSALGKCPPFLIINAKKLIVEPKDTFLARDYPWGVCNVESEKYSDIGLLHKLLLFHFEDTIIDLADSLSEDCVYKIQKKKEKINSFRNGMILSSAALGLLGFGIYKVLK
jgi:septin family protein